MYGWMSPFVEPIPMQDDGWCGQLTLPREIMLVADSSRLVEMLHGNDDRTREKSRELTYEEWRALPWHVHYIDNVCRLGSSLL